MTFVSMTPKLINCSYPGLQHLDGVPLARAGQDGVHAGARHQFRK